MKKRSLIGVLCALLNSNFSEAGDLWAYDYTMCEDESKSYGLGTQPWTTKILGHKEPLTVPNQFSYNIYLLSQDGTKGRLLTYLWPVSLRNKFQSERTLFLSNEADGVSASLSSRFDMMTIRLPANTFVVMGNRPLLSFDWRSKKEGMLNITHMNHRFPPAGKSAAYLTESYPVKIFSQDHKVNILHNQDASPTCQLSSWNNANQYKKPESVECPAEVLKAHQEDLFRFSGEYMKNKTSNQLELLGRFESANLFGCPTKKVVFSRVGEPFIQNSSEATGSPKIPAF